MMFLLIASNGNGTLLLTGHFQTGEKVICTYKRETVHNVAIIERNGYIF